MRSKGPKLEMKKGLWLATSSLIATALLLGGCAGDPKGMKSPRELTEDEKDRVMEIALNTPEASKWRERESKYKTGLRWIAVVWENSEASEWLSLDYEWEADENYQFIPESAAIYPEVRIWFGEPTQWIVQVAVDLDTGKVALVEEYPARGSPTPEPPVRPKKTPPSGPPEYAN